jgi:two-component system OmpR family sensor kinase
VHEHGGGAAELTWATDGDDALVSVVDHGPGLPAVAVDQAFERFFRADPSRSVTEGAGLGLSLVQWIAERHGGSVGIESELGVGTTVLVTLPRVSGRMAPAVPAHS